jgi:hypothetical protein
MNDLNILSAESFIHLVNKIKIHPNCIKHSDNFKLKDKVLLVANCDSDLFLHPMIRSLYKNVNQDEFTLCIFDNSWSAKFNEDIYFNYGFDNILFLDNTINFQITPATRGIVDINEPVKYPDYFSSIIHCKSIDFCLKYLKQEGVKDLILADSDVLFKQNPFNVIDRNYTCVGNYEQKFNRFAPYFLYFNLDKLNIDYYDPTRMFGLSTDILYHYETGGAFTETYLNRKEPFKEVDIYDYIEHFGGGSYVFSARDLKGQHNIECSPENQPQLSFELVYKWLKKNSNLYF